jgi:hypothetical protein
VLGLGSTGCLHQTLYWISEWHRAFEAGTDLGVFNSNAMERYEALLQKLKPTRESSFKCQTLSSLELEWLGLVPLTDSTVRASCP